MKLFLMIALIGFTYRLDEVKTRKRVRPIVGRDRVSAEWETQRRYLRFAHEGTAARAADPPSARRLSGFQPRSA
jgi:hypothetical protein